MGTGTKTKSLRLAGRQIYCSHERFWKLFPVKGRDGGCCQRLKISVGFLWNLWEDSSSHRRQHDPHTPWSQSHQQQAQLDGLSDSRPTTCFHPRSPWRRITALQMSVTQVWMTAQEHETHVKCELYCSVSPKCLYPHSSSTSNASQIKWLIPLLWIPSH